MALDGVTKDEAEFLTPRDLIDEASRAGEKEAEKNSETFSAARQCQGHYSSLNVAMRIVNEMCRCVVGAWDTRYGESNLGDRAPSLYSGISNAKEAATGYSHPMNTNSTFVPIQAEALEARLAAAGFVDITLDRRTGGFSIRAGPPKLNSELSSGIVP